MKIPELERERILWFRLHSHHLDRYYDKKELLEAAGACGMQNSPPGAWETAAFNRLSGITKRDLDEALYENRSLLQAWSFRGAPVVFPAGESGVFLSALCAREEEPWIYTRGLEAALQFLDLPSEPLLEEIRRAVLELGDTVIWGKTELDHVLAETAALRLPRDKQALWQAPSMYDGSGRQTVGEAAVSFLLRPCSFQGLLVFGERRGNKPAFTRYESWIGQAARPKEGDTGRLARKYLHCYGPATVQSFGLWLGGSDRQAARLWDGIREELEMVRIGKRTAYLLKEDLDALLRAREPEREYVFVGPHDPYLDLRDRDLILEDQTRRRLVWRTSGNPGVILRNGRVAGIFRGGMGKERAEAVGEIWDGSRDRAAKELRAWDQALAEAFALQRK